MVGSMRRSGFRCPAQPVCRMSPAMFHRCVCNHSRSDFMILVTERMQVAGRFNSPCASQECGTHGKEEIWPVAVSRISNRNTASKAAAYVCRILNSMTLTNRMQANPTIKLSPQRTSEQFVFAERPTRLREIARWRVMKHFCGQWCPAKPAQGVRQTRRQLDGRKRHNTRPAPPPHGTRSVATTRR